MNSHETTGRSSPRRRRSRVGRRGFTLLEALMAAGILMVMVVAVTGAITAGQQHAYEAQLRIAGALAAEELLGRLATVPYDNLATWHNYVEPVGQMKDMDGVLFPATFNGVGRCVKISTSVEELPGIGVNIGGRTIEVRAYDADDRTLAHIEHFVTEPASATIPEEEEDGGLLGGLLGK